ncbi:MAG: hypothetical protein ACE366_24500 [Bradymonadia bacterium]
MNSFTLPGTSSRSASRLRAVLFAGLATTWASGCAEQDVSMTMEFALPVNNFTCTPPQTITATTPILTRGTVDLSMARSYVMYPVVFNNMPDLRTAKGFTQPTAARTNTSNIILKRAEVRYLPQERLSVTLPSKVELPLSGSVATSAANTVGSTTVGLEVFNDELLSAIRNSDEFLGVGAQGEAVPLRNTVEMVVGVKVFGTTVGGQDQESNEFLFPIDICNGCLVTVPNTAVDPAAPTPNCLRFDPFSFDNSSIACPNLVGQDLAVDCRVCKSQPATPLSAQLCEPSTGF